jgi:hypothetical protein
MTTKWASLPPDPLWHNMTRLKLMESMSSLLWRTGQLDMLDIGW